MGLFGKKEKDKNVKEPSLKKAKDSPFLEYEEDEATNPKIRLYNDIVRRAYSYKTEEFSTYGLDDDEAKRVFKYVTCDYPELFWLDGCHVENGIMTIFYRCITTDGQIDVKDIERKKKELRKSAKYFTRGITKKTKPYDALITIYRRLILELDYDGVGLKTEESRGDEQDISTDDNLRSLYSALVNRKVVCAGYAVAMQYLLQSVGISCGYVSSERQDGSGHGFNALKIGKYVYYIDVTWGDRSDTLTGKKDADDIFYDYCCVPYKEFLMTGEDSKYCHIPNKKFYPDLEEFKDTNHEYFRFRKSYLVRYDENIIANAFARAAMTYDAKEMGRFCIPFRCHDSSLMNYVMNQLGNGNNMAKIVAKAKALCKKKRRAVKLFTDTYSISGHPDPATIYVYFK